MSDIGATPSGRWQFWQLRCRIGAMSFVNVTSGGAPACCALNPIGIVIPAAATTTSPIFRTDIRLSFGENNYALSPSQLTRASVSPRNRRTHETHENFDAFVGFVISWFSCRAYDVERIVR